MQLKISEYIPFEFLNQHQIVIYFLVNERIPQSSDNNNQDFVFSIYFRLFLNTSFIQSIPGDKLESWLFSIVHQSTIQQDVFEKLIKKSLILMLREPYLENLKSLTQKVVF